MQSASFHRPLAGEASSPGSSGAPQRPPRGLRRQPRAARSPQRRSPRRRSRRSLICSLHLRVVVGPGGARGAVLQRVVAPVLSRTLARTRKDSLEEKKAQLSQPQCSGRCRGGRGSGSWRPATQCERRHAKGAKEVPGPAASQLRLAGSTLRLPV